MSLPRAVSLGPRLGRAVRRTVGRYSAAQPRIIEAALDLFAEHGVSGTSLQMIADAIGVTKAAVYHQFKTKDEIVLAVAEVELARLEAAVTPPRPSDPRRGRARCWSPRMIDLAVERRRMESILQRDPVIVRFLAEHEPFRRVMDRLYRLLMGGTPTPGRGSGGDAHGRDRRRRDPPARRDLDDETLRSQSPRQVRKLLPPR